VLVLRLLNRDDDDDDDDDDVVVAVSTTWGFPQTCPEGCSCSCYDCSDESCKCGMPQGFCEMLPSHMLVDWVRNDGGDDDNDDDVDDDDDDDDDGGSMTMLPP
jgi:hypothetical protein